MSLMGLLLLIPETHRVLRVATGMLLCLLFSTVLLVASPYLRHDENMLAVAGSIALSCTFFASLLIKIFTDATELGGIASAERLLGFTSTYEIASLMFVFCVLYLVTVLTALVAIGWRTVRLARSKRKHEDRVKITGAVESLGRLKHPAVVVSFDRLCACDKMLPHEVMRNNGDLAIIDTYPEFKDFCAANPVLFVSHQWLSHREPDPEGQQFKQILDCCVMLCGQLDIPISKLYIWMDYFSIPQANKNLQYFAINSLHIYASCVRYFLVVAPPALHANGSMCNVHSYQTRGWCRLELFSKFSSGGFDDVYVAGEGSIQSITSQGEDGLADWTDAALGLYSGQFTDPADMKKLVDVSLGLLANILSLKDHSPDVRMLYDKMKNELDEIFPRSLFRDLPAQLTAAMEGEWTNTAGKRGRRESTESSKQLQRLVMMALERVSVSQMPGTAEAARPAASEATWDTATDITSTTSITLQPAPAPEPAVAAPALQVVDAAQRQVEAQIAAPAPATAVPPALQADEEKQIPASAQAAAAPAASQPSAQLAERQQSGWLTTIFGDSKEKSLEA